MAQLNSLIVNGASRLVGPAYVSYGGTTYDVAASLDGIQTNKNAIRTKLIALGVPNVSSTSTLANINTAVQAISNSTAATSTATATNSINCGAKIEVPVGYVKTKIVVAANSLASQTGVDNGKTAADAPQILTGYQAWVNGSKKTGSMPNAAITLNAPDSSKEPTISRNSFTISGITDAAAGNATTTAPTSSSTNKVWIKVSSAANTASYTPTATVGTQGYTNSVSYTGTAVTVGAAASKATYVPITEGSCSASIQTRDASASGYAVGVSTSSTQTNYYVEIRTMPGQVKGIASINSAGWIKSGDETSWTDVDVIAGNNVYLSTYSLPSSIYQDDNNKSKVNLKKTAQTISASGKVCTQDITIPAVNFYYTGSSAPTTTTGYTNGDLFLVV